ncbi:hypothetical protein HY798_01325 [Candidatus Falkowbacteria bacterium]|nr:hypothetical protein [Candidatus Falkowbacteria bacterium]
MEKAVDIMVISKKVSGTICPRCKSKNCRARLLIREWQCPPKGHKVKYGQFIMGSCKKCDTLFEIRGMPEFLTKRRR